MNQYNHFYPYMLGPQYNLSLDYIEYDQMMFYPTQQKNQYNQNYKMRKTKPYYILKEQDEEQYTQSEGKMQETIQECRKEEEKTTTQKQKKPLVYRKHMAYQEEIKQDITSTNYCNIQQESENSLDNQNQLGLKNQTSIISSSSDQDYLQSYNQQQASSNFHNNNDQSCQNQDKCLEEFKQQLNYQITQINQLKSLEELIAHLKQLKLYQDSNNNNKSGTPLLMASELICGIADKLNIGTQSLQQLNQQQQQQLQINKSNESYGQSSDEDKSIESDKDNSSDYSSQNPLLLNINSLTNIQYHNNESYLTYLPRIKFPDIHNRILKESNKQTSYNYYSQPIVFNHKENKFNNTLNKTIKDDKDNQFNDQNTLLESSKQLNKPQSQINKSELKLSDLLKPSENQNTQLQQFNKENNLLQIIREQKAQKSILKKSQKTNVNGSWDEELQSIENNNVAEPSLLCRNIEQFQIFNLRENKITEEEIEVKFQKMQRKALEGVKDLKLGVRIFEKNIFIYEKLTTPFLKGYNLFQNDLINLIVDWCQNESQLQEEFPFKFIADISIQDKIKGFFNQILLRPNGLFRDGSLQLISKFVQKPIWISSNSTEDLINKPKQTCKAMEFTFLNLNMMQPEIFFQEINLCNKYLNSKTFDYEQIDLEHIVKKCQESLNYEFKLDFEKSKMVRQLIGALNSLADKTFFIFGIFDIDNQREIENFENNYYNDKFNKKNIEETLQSYMSEVVDIIKENIMTPDSDEIKLWQKQNEITLSIGEEKLSIEFQILKISDKLYPIKMAVPSSSNLILMKNLKNTDTDDYLNFTYVRQNASVNIIQGYQQEHKCVDLINFKEREINDYLQFKSSFLSRIVQK